VKAGDLVILVKFHAVVERPHLTAGLEAVPGNSLAGNPSLCQGV
jgi:hypothetical protein